MVSIKRQAVPKPARLGLGLRLVGVAGQCQRPHPPTNRPSFYTDP